MTINQFSHQYLEFLHQAYGQFFNVGRVLFQRETDHQHLIIFENDRFGRVMALDGVIQTTEKDEFIYHEMLAHVPILSHGNVSNALIIGGGDGGMLREVLKHQNVQVTQVEIDQAVIDLCKEYLPNHSQGAFDDPRANIVIDDGLNFVRQTEQRFDVIISDSTDPIGPGEVLFSEDFYAACQRCLNEGGVLVTQNGVAYLQLEEAQNTAKRLNPLFADVHFYSAAVPTYVGGIMVFGWGTDNKNLRQIPLQTLQERFQASEIATRYYNPAIHQASFAMPQYLQEAVGL